MKILFISNTDGALYVFRRQLLKRLLDEGWSVSSITSDGKYVERLSAMGVRTLTADFAGTSASLPANARLLLNLRKLVVTERPDVVHNFTHKPAIFGTIAARLCGVKQIFITITGLGKLFTYNDPKTKLLRLLLLAQYRMVLQFATKVFFLNSDDRDYFVKKGMIAPDRAILLNGEGVDLLEVKIQDREQIIGCRRMLAAEMGTDLAGKIVVVFNARALKEKGVNVFYEAARSLQESSARYVFVHLGLVDSGSGSSITRETIESWSKTCGVHYLGFKENIQDYMTACDVVVLPSSYREGVPRSLIEALALDKYIITTDTPGCRETVQEGWNGVFCKAGDAHDLAAKIMQIDEHLLQKHGGRSRALCEQKFDVEQQIALTLDCYALSRAAHG